MKRLALLFILFTIYSVSYGVEWKSAYKLDVISTTNIGFDTIVNLGELKTNKVIVTNIDSAVFLNEIVVTNDDMSIITNYLYTTNANDIIHTNEIVSYNKKFQIVYSGNLSTGAINQIISSKDNFYSWPELTIDSLKYKVNKDTVEILINPSAVTYKNKNYIGNIPAGMLFVLSDNILQYDFRITKDNVFVRIKGIFIDKNELFDKIALAVSDPILYVRRNEPDYMLEQIDKHEEQVALLKQQLEYTRNAFIISENSGKLIEQDVINAVINYQKAHSELKTAKDVYESFRKDEAAFAIIKDNKYKFSQKTVEIILRVYLGIYE